MSARCGRFLWLVWRRMKACIDEFQPNTSQASYFEGFWKMTSIINVKIEVENSKNLSVPIADSQHMFLKRNEFLPVWPSLSYLPSNPCLF